MKIRYLLLLPFMLKAQAKVVLLPNSMSSLSSMTALESTHTSNARNEIFYLKSLKSMMSNKSYKTNSKGTILEHVDTESTYFNNIENLTDWFNLDPISGTEGANVDKAYAKYGNPKNQIIVAVIDSGVDVNHEDLQGKIWINSGEIAGNQIDDDGNGYVDDIFGWNFIGAKDGMATVVKDSGRNGLRLIKGNAKKQVHHDTLAQTRELLRLRRKQEQQDLTDQEFTALNQLNSLVSAQKESHLKSYTQYQLAKMKYLKNELILKAAGLETIDYSTVEAFTVDESKTELVKAKKEMLSLLESGMTLSRIDSSLEWHNINANYYYNVDYNSRDIVKDDSNISDPYYGNNDVIGPDPSHGTHVAGIIAADRNNKLGIQGIASNVKIMALRVIPDGDERDKDVAHAIIYAVNNGAKIINMSFGKTIPENKELVDEAIKYAEENGVLLVHAAGNSYADNDQETVYPNKNLTFENRATNNWLEVGASSYKIGSSLAAGFSNYGKNTVDLFAPGVNIMSTTPNNQYDAYSGTSMACPVVAGVAALLWSFDPNLSVAELRDLILNNTRKFPDLYVYKVRLGKVLFSNLSSNGGIIDAYGSLEALLR